ncbi:hypothetical protein BWI96_05625 [Siphonobacter sp. SORGH_AS_0500]|uniref:alpha-L-fucosidase n=1 Tax=Siphonobacter sp. SORGH_AS_0500 TaxID=1864824 RepID=UPI000CAFBFEF|nr:alpha-L-fucosidase [Siphonobacter sp. SORGH_AS_0500]PKK37355.1 hypothetical protein BWI96_05625 [Siphonobacter sp. SORGH_AS_0500]
MKAFLSLLISLMPLALWAQLTITTTSSTAYRKDRGNAIYPAFVDHLPYQSWTEAGSKDYFQLRAEGGKYYSWILTQGHLPDGLSLSTEGRIQGTPEKEGTYTFTVQVTSGNRSASKKLTMVAEPYRAQWYERAKFGVNVSCGFLSEPRIVGAWTMPKDTIQAKIRKLEARMSAFDAQTWVNETVNLGGKFLNYAGHSFDAWRMWPSTTPTNGEMKTTRNYVGELITACHNKGIKFISYFAPDKGGNPDNTDYAAWDPKIATDFDAWGTMNIGLCRELVDMGADGLWVDVGATPELFTVDPRWFDWQKIVAYARTKNPYFIFLSNPGIRAFGSVVNYPYNDVAVFEGEARMESVLIGVGHLPAARKKMAAETSILLDKEWAWSPSRGTPNVPAKDPEVIIDFIKRNWANGATISLNWPVRVDGTFIVPEYRAALTKIGAFVRANQPWLPAPELQEAGGQVTLKAVGGTQIFYTTDGKTPGKNSRMFTGKLPVSKMIRAVAIGKNGNSSREAQRPARVVESLEGYSTGFASSKDYTSRIDTLGYFRGMRVVVGASDLTLAAVGHPDAGQISHEILIKEYATDKPVLVFKGSAVVKEAGFNYLLIPETRLEAGHSYLIAFKEAGPYRAHTLTVVPQNPDVRIVEKYILNAQGDRIPVKKDGYGALLALKYRRDSETSKNLALGKPVAFLSNKNGALLNPSAEILFPENGVDGDMNTVAIGGGEYAYTYRIDLLESTEIRQIKLFFYPENIATELEIYTSLDGSDKTRRLSMDNAKLKTELSLPLGVVKARYVYIKALKPDGPEQPGAQMSIGEVQVFK